MRTETFMIDGMHCGGCVSGVRRAIERHPVARLEVTIGSATVEYDEAKVTCPEIIESIRDAGYEVRVPGEPR